MQTLTMRGRLFGSLGAITLFVVLLSAAAVGTIMRLRTLAVEEVGANTRRVELTGAVRASFVGMQRAQRGVILFTHEHDKKNMEDNASLFESDHAKLGEALQALRAVASEGQAKAALLSIEERAANWRSRFPELRRFCEKGEPSEATRIAVTAITPLIAEMEKAVSELQRVEKESLETAIGHVQSSAGTGVWTGLLSAGLALGAALLGLWTVKSVTTGLGGLTDKMASGANEVAAAARQIASSSQALARGTSDQAASLEETSASSTEVTSMTAQNAGNSRSAAALMGEVDARVASANRTLSEMVASMNEISTSSEKISRIIKVIDEIAFQTNILALNAAVEAARAGEAGMGFAVVADEVRNLAQRSAQAAKDTAALIEESITRSGQGSAKLDEVKRAIEGITEGATKAKTLIDEVQVGSHEQARGVEQIGRAITQMEQVTQQNAASAEESASASQELSAQADAMKSTVEEMRRLLGAQAGMTAEPVKPRVKAVLRPQAARPAKPVVTPPVHGLRGLAKAVGKPATPAPKALMPVPPRAKKSVDLPPAKHKAAPEEFPLDADFVEF